MIRRLPGQFQESILQAGGTAYTPGDMGSVLMAVRKNTTVSLAAADGEYAPLQVTSDGKLKVEAAVTVGGKEVGTAAGPTDAGTPALVVRDDGDYTTLRVNAQGALYVTGGGGGVQYDTGVAYTAGDTGVVSLAVNDTGNYGSLRIQDTGELKVVGTVDLGTTDSSALAAVKTAVESIDTAMGGRRSQC